MRPPLGRREPRVLAGVCRGLSVHLGGEAWMWRVGFLALSWTVIVPVIYLVLALTLSKHDDAVAPENQRLAKPLASRRVDSSKLTVAALVALLAITVIGVGILPSGTLGAFIFPLAMVAVGAGIAWTYRDGRWGTISLMVGLATGSFGGVILVANSGPSSPLSTAIQTGIVVLLVAAIVLYPAQIRSAILVQEIDAKRIREETRADMAAHLHDSVLQTLALIRSRAHSPEEVRFLARQQEQELRDYLYTDRPEAETSLAAALTHKAREIEAAYGQEIDLVITGDAPMSPEGQSLIEASGEAMTNACKHGAGPISVYGELGNDANVWIRDRGHGFDLGTITSDRAGIRHSIYGRMERAGGEARIRTPLESGGTEVHLHLPAKEES